MTLTLAQALKNAATAERAAAAFYRQLASQVSDDGPRAFFLKLVDDEIAHAEQLEARGAELGAEFEQALPEAAVVTVETPHKWDFEAALEVEQAFEVAVEAEVHAALTYDALADFATGETQAFLRQLSEREEAHAAALRTKRAEFGF